MTLLRISLPAIAVAVALATNAAAQDTRLSAAPGDVLVQALVTDAPPSPPSIERAPVHFAWPLAADAGPIEAPAPYTAVSREHWRDADGAELARGLAIETTAPGALVLISPVGRDSRPVERDGLHILRGGQVLKADAATATLAPQAALEAVTGTRFAPGALGFRLAPDLGSGRFDLQVAGARGRYVVHVREPDSPFALHVDSPAPGYLAGDRVRLLAALDSGGRPASLHEVGGMLVAPDGREFPLRAVRTHAGVALDAALPREASAVPGLWEAHVLAVADAGGSEVLRDAKVAFEVTAPTARLAGAHAARSDADGRLTFELPVEVGSPGRYEARAVLYGTSHAGDLVPVAVGHAADWLDPGTGRLTLVFPAAVLAGAQAPFELRQLALHDQGRMGRLEYRERAARVARPLRDGR
ncbi:DUF4785 family protein [Luteimonas sp. BDR2-5]|uniref:DUF4785 domain-containing protein n=1 Tax=Proluteimonas luteida TaxID=2878685 RepID=UPI001E641C30|nr:DUF4785 domain-containing protein [Luteimonas sp. BDR2-5]MCD9027607.1 DUF4785 family protein [Luteimonas sp. BDR2-5]